MYLPFTDFSCCVSRYTETIQIIKYIVIAGNIARITLNVFLNF